MKSVLKIPKIHSHFDFKKTALKPRTHRTKQTLIPHFDFIHILTEALDMKLDEYEYAFYTAVADNESARELMEKDTLRELAVVLAQSVRENASIDWTIKESVRAKLRINVKKILRKYGYPPNMAELATDNVIKQAEIIAKEIQNS